MYISGLTFLVLSAYVLASRRRARRASVESIRRGAARAPPQRAHGDLLSPN